MRWIAFSIFLALASVGCDANAGRLAVVQIEVLETDAAPAGRGTGFFVTRNLVMTNQHVVEGAGDRPVIVAHRSYKVWGRVVAIEPGLDLALIQVAGRGPRPLRFCTDTSEGDEITVWTYDFGRFRSKDGMIENQWFNRTSITAGLIPGNSGSPVMHGRGLGRCVAGVAKSIRIPDFRGIMVSAFAAQNFLGVYLSQAQNVD